MLVTTTLFKETLILFIRLSDSWLKQETEIIVVVLAACSLRKFPLSNMEDVSETGGLILRTCSMAQNKEENSHKTCVLGVLSWR
jgi:hypothetical protein